MIKTPHLSVLLEEVSQLLDIQPDDYVLDGTVGFGGHSEAFAQKLGPNGRLLGLDRDLDALRYSKNRLEKFPQVTLMHALFSDFPKALEENGWPYFTKALIDIGVSSWQIDQPSRGFSFQSESPLDMRMDTSEHTKTAAQILNTYSKEKLIHLFETYGEIRRADRLVQNILSTRELAPILTTDHLKTMIKKSFFFKNDRALMMRTFAQVFQALRIEVNQELAQLDAFLNHVPQWIHPGGRLCVITFHSLEDRIVKTYFKGNLRFESIGKKALKPTYAQTKDNPRARSATLRTLQFLG